MWQELRLGIGDYFVLFPLSYRFAIHLNTHLRSRPLESRRSSIHVQREQHVSPPHITNDTSLIFVFGTRQNIVIMPVRIDIDDIWGASPKRAEGPETPSAPTPDQPILPNQHRPRSIPPEAASAQAASSRPLPHQLTDHKQEHVQPARPGAEPLKQRRPRPTPPDVAAQTTSPQPASSRPGPNLPKAAQPESPQPRSPPWAESKPLPEPIPAAAVTENSEDGFLANLCSGFRDGLKATVSFGINIIAVLFVFLDNRLLHKLLSWLPSTTSPEQASPTHAHLTYHRPISEDEAAILPSIIGECEEALLAEDENFAQGMTLDFQKASADAVKLKGLTEELMPDMEAAGNELYITLLDLIEQIDADPEDENSTGDMWWKFWGSSPEQIAEARRDRLHDILESTTGTRGEERDRITNVLKELGKDSMTGKDMGYTGSICKIDKELGKAAPSETDLQHIKAMTGLLCQSVARADPKWKQVLREIVKVGV
ncbi:hypothetical protein G7046_g8450 [Stylonectria norvegica]|nr:hypothetical protein G7046_g8450 [Stylonectria norvegica]